MDSLRSFLFENLDIRGAVVSLGNAWHQMCVDRDDPPAIQSLLGELAAASALIGGNLKTPGRLSFQLQGQGALSMLLVDCDEQLRLKGIARHKLGADDTASGFANLLGSAQFTLTLQAPGRPPYQSIVPLVGDNLADVIEHYLTQSEQQPAHFHLSATDLHASGLFLQKLPDADDRDPDGWNRILHLASTIKPEDLRESPAKMLTKIFPEEDIRLYDPRPVRHHCPRDEEKIFGMLKSLGRTEIESILEERGELYIEDDICRHTYRYGAEILPRLFD